MEGKPLIGVAKPPRAGRVMLLTSGVVAMIAGCTFALPHIWSGARDQIPQHHQLVVGTADVIHNPPLLVDPDEPMELDFRFVCAWQEATLGECSPSGTVYLRDGRGAEHDLPLASVGGSAVDLRAVVPVTLLADGPVSYRATFQVAGQAGLLAWPDAGTSDMVAWPVSSATRVDLVPMTSPQERGELVSSGGWGNGPDEFGRSRGGVGPASFDVDESGDVWVLDQENSRIVVDAPDERRDNLPLPSGSDLSDIAVRDGTVDLLQAGQVSRWITRPCCGSRPRAT